VTSRSAYADTYRMLFNSDPPAPVAWETSRANILSPGRGFMRPFDYTMQLQVGCLGGCLFCYVAAAARLAPADVRGQNGRRWGAVVRNKQNVGKKLKKHLQHAQLAGKTIYWSGVADPYADKPKTLIVLLLPATTGG
jgi:DNA repair photolyase